MRVHLLLPLLSALSLCALAPSQEPPAIELPPGIDFDDLPTEVRAQVEAAQARGAGQGPGSGVAAASQDPAKAAAALKAKQRLQAFKKLVFDRRPSSILKAWAQPRLHQRPL